MDDCTPERVEALATPEHLTGRKQMRELLDDIVGGMDASLRSVFLLHELEEMNLTEIAAHLAIPRGTVASRLRRARAHIRQHLRAIELAWDLGTTTAKRIETPAFLRREKSSPFWRALLETGIFTPASSAMRMKTLTALGLRRSLIRPASMAIPRAGGLALHLDRAAPKFRRHEIIPRFVLVAAGVRAGRRSPVCGARRARRSGSAAAQPVREGRGRSSV